jgi:hypothetical protein
MIRRIPWKLCFLGFLLLDWVLPFGFTHRFFEAHRWFPTNLTRVFAETLMSPGSPSAILLVSASSPRFWVMGSFSIFSIILAARLKTKRAWILLTLQLLVFLSVEFLLPWMGEKNLLSGGLFSALFPVPEIPRGHGRVYGWLYLVGLPSFILLLIDTRRRFV